MNKRSVTKIKHYKIAALLLSTFFYTSMVRAMEPEFPKTNVCKVQLSDDEERSKYYQIKEEFHRIKEELSLIEEKEKSIQLLHQNAWRQYCYEKLLDAKLKVSSIRVMSDEHTVMRPDCNFRLYSVGYEECPKCIKMLNEAYDLIKKSTRYLPVNEKFNEEVEAVLHLTIDEQHKQLQALEEENFNRQKVFNLWREDMEKKIKALEEKNKSLENKNTFLEEEKKNYQKEVENLNNRIEELESERYDLYDLMSGVSK